MGYILPVAQYEYMNYQNRDIKRTGEGHYIEKPYKIKLDLNQQLMDKQKFAHKQPPKNKQILFEKEEFTHSKQDQSIAPITGKGSLFNETI